MSDANAPASCPDGHDGAIRLLSVFASTGAASVSGGAVSGGAASGGSSAMPAGGCGSGCGCHGG